MRRNPFLDFCFVILVITVLMLQHSAAVFGPTAHGGAVTEGHSSHGYPLGFDGEFSRRLRAPANFSRAAAFFDDAWHRTMVFEEWWMDYTASAWELFNASSPAETDLLEARFHVANAEVFADAMSESDRAMKELVRAETSLDAARTIADARLNPQLSTISEEMATAKTHEQTKDASSTVPFETIKADLDHLIEVVRSSKT
jgi:hypothetical protein